MIKMAASNDSPEGDLPCLSSDVLYENQQVVKDLSKCYSEYMKVDITRERKLVEEATDDLLIKLEEFMSLLDLVRTDNSICLMTTLPRIQVKFRELQGVFQSIDRLEAFVNVVRRNVDNLEARVTTAEKELVPENTFSKFLRPLFSKRDATNNRAERQPEPYQPPPIFRTDQYIPRLADEISEATAETLQKLDQT